jgi:hypothetical protein
MEKLTFFIPHLSSLSLETLGFITFSIVSNYGNLMKSAGSAIAPLSLCLKSLKLPPGIRLSNS